MCTYMVRCSDYDSNAMWFSGILGATVVDRVHGQHNRDYATDYWGCWTTWMLFFFCKCRSQYLITPAQYAWVEGTVTTIALSRKTYFPLLHIVLLNLVLLDKLVQGLLQAIWVGLQNGNYLFHRPLSQHSIDHAEAFPVSWKRFQGIQDKSDISSALDLDFVRKQRQKILMLKICLRGQMWNSRRQL